MSPAAEAARQRQEQLDELFETGALVLGQSHH